MRRKAQIDTLLAEDALYRIHGIVNARQRALARSAPRCRLAAMKLCAGLCLDVRHCVRKHRGRQNLSPGWRRPHGEMQRSRKTDETAPDDGDVGMPIEAIRSMRERLSGVAPVGLQLHALSAVPAPGQPRQPGPEMSLISMLLIEGVRGLCGRGSPRPCS